MFQTVLLTVLPIVGLFAAAIVLLYTSLESVFTAYRGVIVGGFALVSIATAYLIVRYSVGDPKTHLDSISEYGAERNRLLTNIQFWCVLGGSLALPWLAAVLRNLAS